MSDQPRVPWPPPEPPRSHKFAVASVVFAVGTWVFAYTWEALSFIPPWAVFVILNVIGITAVVLGFIARHAMSETSCSMAWRGVATTGIVVGGFLPALSLFATLIYNLPLILPG